MTDIRDDPTVDELHQDEEHGVNAFAPVAVAVEGVARVQLLPAQGGSAKSVTLAADTPAVKIAKPDPRRKKLLLLPVDQRVAFGYSQAEADASSAALIPAGTGLPLDNRDAEVWVRSAVLGEAATLTIVTDLWAQ